MKRFLTATAALVAFGLPATAAPTLQRVRGTVTAVGADSVTLKDADGRSRTVAIAPDTTVVSVVKSSLDQVGDGKFIGTATKGEPPVALEVVIFPADMKGTGEGHYDWDAITDTTAGGAGLTKSAMTNGTIKSSSGSGAMTKSTMTNGTLTKSTMTNGTVKSGAGTGGGKKITVTYDNGQSLDVAVPASAPIVEFVHADKAVVKPGASLFTVAAVDGDKLTAKLLAVGKDGVKPPM